MKTQIKLTNPTDDELSAAVAEHVAGWKYLVGTIGGHLGIPPPPNRGIAEKVTSYATSADAVLPLLNKLPFWTAQFDGRQFTVTDGHMDEDSDNMSSAPTLPRAACIALLRANGIEVE